MTYAFPKLFTAAAAAALISVGSVAAQPSQTVDPQASRGEIQERVTPDSRTQIGEMFRGMGVPRDFDATEGTVLPEGVYTNPVPSDVVEMAPDLQDYHYVTLADGRTAIVHPGDRDVVMVLD